MGTHFGILAWENQGTWRATVHGVAKHSDMNYD